MVLVDCYLLIYFVIFLCYRTNTFVCFYILIKNTFSFYLFFFDYFLLHVLRERFREGLANHLFFGIKNPIKKNTILNAPNINVKNQLDEKSLMDAF